MDCLESKEKAAEFMHEMFALNPLGVEFDPEEWLRRLAAGEPEGALLERKVHEPVSPLRGEIGRLISGE